MTFFQREAKFLEVIWTEQKVILYRFLSTGHRSCINFELLTNNEDNKCSNKIAAAQENRPSTSLDSE